MKEIWKRRERIEKEKRGRGCIFLNFITILESESS
jgi:hypothetical protein